jgi:hypothetical protein
VAVSYKNSPGTSGSPQTLEGSDVFFLRGPIGRRYVKTASVQELQITHTDLTGAPRATTVIGTSNLERVLEWVSFVVTRQDGGPDNCGDPPIDYPDDKPGPQDFSFPVVVPVGGDNFTFPVVIPFIDLSPEFNLNPQIKVNVGPFNLTFELGGVDVAVNPTINLPDSVPVGGDPRPPINRPPTEPPLPPPGGNCPPCPDLDLTPVLNKLEDIDDDLELVAENVELLLDCDRCDIPPIGSNRYAVAEYVGVTSGDWMIGTNAPWVEVTLTQIPANPRMQIGDDGPDVYYAGWYAFGSGAAPADRNAIRYAKQAISIPEGHNRFTFTLYPGYISTVRVFSLIDED